MTEATLAQADIVPDSVAALTEGFPKWERLSGREALETCDGHANGAVSALVKMILASRRTIALCGNCARRFGYEHTRTAPVENRQKGSVH